MRALSDEMKDVEVRSLILRLANDYDNLADRAEERAAHNEPGPSEQHAAEYRQVAAQMKDPQLKKRLEDMADVWDMLARERRQGVVENNPDQT
jgi:rubrerythrin